VQPGAGDMNGVEPPVGLIATGTSGSNMPIAALTWARSAHAIGQKRTISTGRLWLAGRRQT